MIMIRKYNTLIIGVGSASYFMVQSVSHDARTEHAEFIIADIDPWYLEQSKVQGFKTLCCNERIDIENSFLTSFDRVFIVAGLGGMTATKLLFELVKVVKKVSSIEVIVIVTLPFKFEGEKRVIKAHAAVERLIALDVKCVILPNDNLVEKYSDINMFNAFQMSDEEVKSIILAHMETQL